MGHKEAEKMDFRATHCCCIAYVLFILMATLVEERKGCIWLMGSGFNTKQRSWIVFVGFISNDVCPYKTQKRR